MGTGKKVSELTEILNADLANDDYLMAVDSSESLNKKLSIFELGLRYNSFPTLSVTNVTSNYAILLTDTVLLADSSLGSITLTLPSAGPNSGKFYRVIKKSGSVDFNKVILTDGLSFSKFLLGAGESFSVISTGASWEIYDWSKSDVMEFVPTLNSGITNVDINISKISFHREFYFCNGQVTFTGVPAGSGTTFIMGIPTGLTIDVQRLPGNNATSNAGASMLGPMSTWYNAGTGWFLLVPKYKNTTAVSFWVGSQELTQSLLATGDSLNILLEVPVV